MDLSGLFSVAYIRSADAGRSTSQNQTSLMLAATSLKSKHNLRSFLRLPLVVFATRIAIRGANKNTWVFCCSCEGRNRNRRSAGLDMATSHSGRRTFITTLAHKGVSVRVLAALAGHKSVQQTLRYIELNENVLRAAVELD